MSLIAKVLVSVLAKKASKSVTSWIGGTLVAGGAAAAISPELLELIPAQWRGYAITAIGIGVVLARHRADIINLYAQLRAEVKAAIAAAEKPTDTQ